MIYLDNGATSFRKPPAVYKAVQEAISTAIESVTGVVATDVNVNVCGIIRK